MSKQHYTTRGSQKQQDKHKEKFNKKKGRNVKMLEFIVRHVSDKTAERVKYCGNILAFATDKAGEKKRLLEARFCKNTFCPMCGWRQAKRDALKIAILMKHIQLTEDRAFLFLTLTAPNVRGDKLKEEITRYNENFKKMMDRREVVKVVKGYVRKLEVTYNKEKYITQEMWDGSKLKLVNWAKLRSILR